jgi:hypothetical protein
MPEKAALQTPLKPALWYAKSSTLNTNNAFTLGPWPSVDDALRQLQDDYQMPRGTLVQIGQMLPWVPDSRANCILESLMIEACGPMGPGEIARPWEATLRSIAERDNGAAVAELNGALNLVLMGWLTAHECHPNFGTIENVQGFSWDGERFTPEPVEWIEKQWPAGPAMPAPPRPEPVVYQQQLGRTMRTPPPELAALAPTAEAAAYYAAPGEPEKWEQCLAFDPKRTYTDGRGVRCQLKAGHAGEHQWEVPF